MELQGWDPLFRTMFEGMAASVVSDGRRAVFDADGTLWAGDAGQQMVARLAEQGVVLTADGKVDAEAVLREYDAMERHHPLTAYSWCVSVMATVPESTVIAFSNDVAEFMAKRAHFQPMRSLLLWLHEQKFELAVVSASNRWVIESMVRHLELPVTAVVAMDCDVEGGKLTGHLRHPLVNGPGKVDAILARLGWTHWAFAAGNSVHDIPMMSLAQHAALMIDPNDDAYRQAVAQGFWIRRFRKDTVDR